MVSGYTNQYMTGCDMWRKGSRKCTLFTEAEHLERKCSTALQLCDATQLPPDVAPQRLLSNGAADPCKSTSQTAHGRLPRSADEVACCLQVCPS
jgi:hypothetical protein